MEVGTKRTLVIRIRVAGPWIPCKILLREVLLFAIFALLSPLLSSLLPACRQMPCNNVTVGCCELLHARARALLPSRIQALANLCTRMYACTHTRAESLTRHRAHTTHTNSTPE
jgi:hypothetical protein